MEHPFDPAEPPVDPPPGCRHRMAWLLARALWAAHQPAPDGRCQVPGCSPLAHPCLPYQLAQQGLGYACGVPGAWQPAWHAVLREGER